ncbi:twin-arginine translocation signal domain-containing protein [Roseibium limicola]|uniref:Twin-arginine translocation signal domain-containing protein n=1 Tax=Roseibium limicola TaxID=2816037 RepID=A0A939EMU0_9HYPH|nr:twin-arginine translocation signal domain-containing protein [Roseibium limicola]MBO0345045.1 twin-arginine translocation signal domain-containing protein [Roseibium limicola]
MTDKRKTPASPNEGSDRRGFLKLAGLGTLASGATLVAGEAVATEVQSETAVGYRETDHVKKVYETARF